MTIGALAACGGGSGEPTHLEIELMLPYAAADGGMQKLELTCDPPGGTVPDPAGLCSKLAADDAMLSPPALTGTCAGAPGIPPDVGIHGTFQGRSVRIYSLRSCDGPAERALVAERWYRALGVEP